jgi:hypothetical protein
MSDYVAHIAAPFLWIYKTVALQPVGTKLYDVPEDALAADIK